MKHTPLYEQQKQQSAIRWANFHGWEMPLDYGSQIAEHHAVRRDVGVFDVSHMAIVDLLGPGGRQLLRYGLSNDVDRLRQQGSAMYTCMLNPQGGIIDDLLVYYRSVDNYRLVMNAANRQRDLAWLRHCAEGLSVGIQEHHDLAMLAIQGPHSISKAQALLWPKQQGLFDDLSQFAFIERKDWFIARTGYTGELGLELMLPKEQAGQVWQTLLNAGVQACGLGARDTLRLEAGLLLHGQDMDEKTSPLESGLAWTVAWEPKERNFVGRDALLQQKEKGVSQKLVGLILEEKGMLRRGQWVLMETGGEGVITSGSYSPTLKRAIALARVPCTIGTQCQVMVRTHPLWARVVKPRFVQHGKALVDF